jgi:ankyrin repeat protein
MVNQPDDYGCTPAHFAAAGGRLDTQPDPACMELVVQADANINAVDNAGFTPLHIAAQNGYVCVELAKQRVEFPAFPCRSLCFPPFLQHPSLLFFSTRVCIVSYWLLFYVPCC